MSRLTEPAGVLEASPLKVAAHNARKVGSSVLITNDIWLGTGHLPDVTLAKPIFRNGKLIAGNEQNYRVVITKDDTTIVDGAGDPKDVEGRVNQIKAEVAHHLGQNQLVGAVVFGDQHPEARRDRRRFLAARRGWRYAAGDRARAP